MQWPTSALLVLRRMSEKHDGIKASLGYLHNEFQTSLGSIVSKETTNNYEKEKKEMSNQTKSQIALTFLTSANPGI